MGVRWGAYARAVQAEEMSSAKFQRHQGAWFNRLSERTEEERSEQSLNVKRRHWKGKWDSSHEAISMSDENFWTCFCLQQ